MERFSDPDSAVGAVSGLAIDTLGHESGWHTHRRTQLLYLSEGSVTVYTEARIGRLASLQAIWLPAGHPHRTVSHGRFGYRSLYFDTAVYPDLPQSPLILEVNPLLRELILRITEWPSDQALSTAQERLTATLFDEMAAATSAPLHLPMPREKRLRVIAQALLTEPGLPYSLEEWGGRVGASGRTLARLFLHETGLTFAQWRTQCRLLVAHSRLAEGVSVTAVAHLVGYASDSAFIAMYRRLYGNSPGRKSRLRTRSGQAQS